MSRSQNIYQPYPPSHKPTYRPAGVVSDAVDDTVTLATQEDGEWRYTSTAILGELERLTARNAIIYAPVKTTGSIRRILQRAGVPEPTLASTSNGGCHVKDRKTGRSIALLLSSLGLPDIWFCDTRPFNGMRPRDRADEVFSFLNWAFLHGVPADEPGSMTFNLWKTTFPPRGYKTWFYEEQHPGRPPKSLYVTGGKAGREWQLMMHGWDLSIPGHYKHATLLDCKMAYPYVMAHDTAIERDGLFPMQLHATKDARLPEPWELGISRVVVHAVPDLPWSPLPYRNPETGKWEPLRQPMADLTVTNRELWLALRRGVDLEVKESYVGVKGTYRQPFSKWYALYCEARELQPGSVFAKWIFNRLWGQLMIAGHGDDFDFLPWAADIVARLRVKLHNEALTPETGAVYVETDSVIVTKDLPKPYRDGPGSWYEKPQDGPVNAETWIPERESTAAWTHADGKADFRGEVPKEEGKGIRKLSDYVTDLCEQRFANDPDWQAWKRQTGRQPDETPQHAGTEEDLF